MVTAEEIRKAREILKSASLYLKDNAVRYNDDETFTIYNTSSGRSLELLKDDIVDIANWVLCLFVYDED